MVSSKHIFFLGALCLVLIAWQLDRVQPLPMMKLSSHERWLSYIPSIEETASQEILIPISLKKVNFIDDESFDKIAIMEKFKPVIDKVIVIPQGFHAYEHSAVV